MKNKSHKGFSKFMNGSLDMPIEDVAAIRIQTAFRAYKVCLVTSYAHRCLEIENTRLTLSVI